MEASGRQQIFRLFPAPVKLAVTVWSVIALIVGGRILINPRTHSVYPIHAHAGMHWVAGDNLYGPAKECPDIYPYSPTVAVSMIPFSLLPMRAGDLLWRLLNVGVYLASLFWLSRSVLPFRPNTTQLAALFLLIVPLSIGSINNGQCNTLIIGLLLAATAAAADERWSLATICAISASLFKVYPLALVLLLTVVYPRQLIGRLALILAAGLALPFLFQHPAYVIDQYSSWIHLLRSVDRSHWPIDIRPRNLQMLFDVWCAPLKPRTVVAVQLSFAAGIAVFAWLGSLSRMPRRPLLTLLLAFGCCWMTLVGPTVESCTFILLAPSLAAALLDAWQEKRPLWARTLLSASYLFFLSAQIAIWFPWGRVYRNLGPQPFANVLFLVYLVYLAVDTWLKHRAGQGRQYTIVSARAA